jgi:hypothetical protein
MTTTFTLAPAQRGRGQGEGVRAAGALLASVSRPSDSSVREYLLQQPPHPTLSPTFVGARAIYF